MTRACAIRSVRARRVWDSRGRPTVEAEVTLHAGAVGRAIVPAGASKGTREALELRDATARFGGLDVMRAVANVNGEIARALLGSPADDQGLKAGDILQQVGRDAIDSPKMAAEKLKEAKKTGKPVLMKVYREGMTRFVAISPRAA